MTGRLASASASGVLAAALVVATLVLAASGAGAAPQTSVPVVVEFTDVRPGDRASTSWPLRVERTATIAGRTVHRDGAGEAEWDVQLCPAGTAGGTGCVDLVGAPVGTVVPQGAYEVRVAVHVLDIGLGEVESVEARVTLQERSTGLASTGADAVGATALAALVAALVGLLLVVLARRRGDVRDEERDRAQAA